MENLGMKTSICLWRRERGKGEGKAPALSGDPALPPDVRFRKGPAYPSPSPSQASPAPKPHKKTSRVPNEAGNRSEKVAQ